MSILAHANAQMAREEAVFGVPVEGCGLDEAVTRVTEERRGALWIVTANPEILLLANRDHTYVDLLRQADLRTVDGFGLWLMLRFVGRKTSRVTGVELAERLVREAADRSWRVALIGGAEGIAQEAARQLQRRYPLLTILAEQGGTISLNGDDDERGEEARHRLTFFDPDLLLVAFGHPRQDFWIKQHASEFPNLKTVVGVGGTFDFWSGKAKRAPHHFQRLGLEWLWRLFREPRRVKRIWNAVVVFPVVFVLSRIKRS